MTFITGYEMTDFFPEPTFIAAAAAGIYCLAFPAREKKPSRPLTALMAAACLAAFFLFIAGLIGALTTGVLLPALYLALAAGFAAEAVSGKPLRGMLSRRPAGFRGGHGYVERWLETTEKISSRADASEIKSFLAEICADTVGASSVYVWLFEGASGTFAANSVKIEPSLRRIRPGHALLEHVKATDGAPFFLEEIADAPGIGPLVRGPGAVVCAPLICHREISGIMLLGRKRGRSGYTWNDLRLLRAITTQAAVQLKNIRLSSDLFDMKESDQFSRMSSFVAHDLKNLANSLSLLAHNAKKNISDPLFQREALKAMETTGAKMRSLAEKMAGAERGLELRRAHSDLREVLCRAAERVSQAAQARLKVERGEPLYCRIDEELVETVFFNMLTNASEATADQGEILVTFETSNGSTSVIIRDTGSGIPLPYLENWLFRPFRTTKKDGFGIGLYQSKAVMDAHGGSIEVESEEGKGTTFTLKFPAYAAGDASLAG